MKIYKEMGLEDFEFWGGAKDFAERLTFEELHYIEMMMDEWGTEDWSATMVNDFFWFDQETIAQWIGTTEEEIWARE